MVYDDGRLPEDMELSHLNPADRKPQLRRVEMTREDATADRPSRQKEILEIKDEIAKINAQFERPPLQSSTTGGQAGARNRLSQQGFLKTSATKKTGLRC